MYVPNVQRSDFVINFNVTQRVISMAAVGLA